MANALWITLIGMGLVFIAILALWGLMALLVRLTAEREKQASEVEANEPEADAAVSELRELKRRAAAAGVALALAMRRPSNDTRPAGTVSPWQAVNRASQLNQRERTSMKKVVR